MCLEAEVISEDTINYEGLANIIENYRLCELTTALQLLVAMNCKCSINPINNPNGDYNHT